MFLIYLLFVSLFTTIQCTYGVYLREQNFTTKYIQCIYDNQISKGIELAISTTQGISYNVTTNLTNIKNVGMQAQLVFSPCRGRNVTLEVNDFITKVPKELYERVWLNASQQSKDQICKWRADNTEQNVRILVQLVNQFLKNDVNIGIIANEQYWDEMFGGTSLFNDLDLFWNPKKIDGIQSFDDFTQFGGWEMPIQKFYKVVQLCGTNITASYYN